MKFAKAFAAVAALSSAVVSALPSVTRTGRYLYQADGTRFFIKGVSYQEQGTVGSNNPVGFPEPTDFIDPLADSAGCTRDLPYLQQLGVNVIRVYSVNSALNHDSCMQALSQAGIYVMLDLALPVNGSIDRVSPAYTTNLLNLYLTTIDAFSGYNNILGYNVGNEVVTAVADTQAAPFIKAFARDIKAYLASKGSTALVGYASTDGDTFLTPLADYLACDTAADSIDIFGLNNYRWCGNADISVYATLISSFQNYPIPAYFSEFGCVTETRTWTEVAAIFGNTQMTTEWSGGVAFSYFPAVGGYGMVNISSDGTSVITGSDFQLLQEQYSNVTFATTPAQSAAGSNTQATCPTEDASSFIGSTTLPPTPVNTPCSCLQSNYYSCEFTNGASVNAPDIIGSLLNYGCSQVATLGGSCTAIGANGTSGTYGPFSVCDPNTKLSYVLSQYYQLENRQATACSFSGNATVVSSGPSSASAANAAESSCAAEFFSGTTLPGTPSSTPPSAQGAGTAVATPSGASGSSGTTGKKSAAATLDARSTLATLVVGVLGVVGGMAVAL